MNRRRAMVLVVVVGILAGLVVAFGRRAPPAPAPPGPGRVLVVAPNDASSTARSAPAEKSAPAPVAAAAPPQLAAEDRGSTSLAEALVGLTPADHDLAAALERAPGGSETAALLVRRLKEGASFEVLEREARERLASDPVAMASALRWIARRRAAGVGEP